MSATYKDIQQKTGVSLSTISKFFNGGNVTARNRAAIETAVEELDFRINPIAQGLKSKRTNTIGLLLYSLSDIYSANIMSRVSAVLRQNGYSSLISDYCDMGDKVESVLTFLLDRMVDGIITIPSNSNGRYLKEARKRNVPVVLLDAPTIDFKTDVAMLDNRSAGALAAKELLRLGHRNVAIITATDDVYSQNEREIGYLTEFKENGVSLKPEYVMRVGSTSEDGIRAGRELMQMKSLPSAIFCTNYYLTQGCVQAFYERGMTIGDTVSLLGFDHFDLTSTVRPPLTLINQPLDSIASTAVKLMLDRIGGYAPPSYITYELSANLVRGSSVRDLTTNPL